MKGGENKENLYFKLYEYITKIENFSCDKINFEREKNKIICARRNQKLSENEKEKSKCELQEDANAICNGKSRAFKENQKKVVNHTSGFYDNESSAYPCNVPEGIECTSYEEVSMSFSFTDSDESSEGEDEIWDNTNNDKLGNAVINCTQGKDETVVFPDIKLNPNNKEDDEFSCDSLLNFSSDEKDKKKSYNTSNYYTHNITSKHSESKNDKIYDSSNSCEIHEGGVIDVSNTSNNRRDSDTYTEIENYYLIYKMNRRMEEHKSVNEIKTIKNKRILHLSEIFKKIDTILSCYKEIKKEVHTLVKNKQFIYKTFYSIFLNYYYRYSEIKLMKLNKGRIERYLQYYTNIEQFEIIMSNIEKNKYAYFLDIYNNSFLKNRTTSTDEACDKGTGAKINWDSDDKRGIDECTEESDYTDDELVSGHTDDELVSGHTDDEALSGCSDELVSGNGDSNKKVEERGTKKASEEAYSNDDENEYLFNNIDDDDNKIFSNGDDQKHPKYVSTEGDSYVIPRSQCMDQKYEMNKCMNEKCMDEKCMNEKCMDEKCMDEKCMEEKYMEEKYMEEKCMDEKCMDEKCMEEKYMEEKRMEEKYRSKKCMDEKYMSKKRMDEKYMNKKCMDEKYMNRKGYAYRKLLKNQSGSGKNFLGNFPPQSDEYRQEKYESINRGNGLKKELYRGLQKRGGEKNGKTQKRKTNGMSRPNRLNKIYKLNGTDKRSAPKKLEKLKGKNEIYYMLQFSEKAIKFFKKNSTYLNAKSKLAKYQSIIKRILKCVINLFRDVLNNADLNIPCSSDVFDSNNPLRDITFCEKKAMIELPQESYKKIKNKNEHEGEHSCKYEHEEGNRYISEIHSGRGGEPASCEVKGVSNINKSNVGISKMGKGHTITNEYNMEGHNLVVEHYQADNAKTKDSAVKECNLNLIRGQKDGENTNTLPCIDNIVTNETLLLLTDDENEINKIYNNMNMIYFSKYINEFEYYKKYKIKCGCMKDIINYIYKKSMIDENNLYVDDYNTLESFYTSTRLKILNNNIIRNFDYFSNSDICKYIKNVCLLSIYISKLEIDLFLSIFNNSFFHSSLSIILNAIGVSVYDNISQNIYELNNIQIIRKIIQIIYVDIIEIYGDNLYSTIRDYLIKICKILKDRLLYIIEMYISYYTKNISSTIPYTCFKPIKKKFKDMVNEFLYDEYLLTNNTGERCNYVCKKEKEEADHDISNNTVGSSNVIPPLCSSNINNNSTIIHNNSSSNKVNVEMSCHSTCDNRSRQNCGENVNDNQSRGNSDDDSSESIDIEHNYKEHEYNINVLNENSVYKPFSFLNCYYNKDTKFSLTGVDINIIGTILILKTINFIMEESTFMDLFNECLDNTYNSIINIYKQHLKNHDGDMINASLYLIKNLSFLLYLFYKVTNDKDFLNMYLDKELTEHLLHEAAKKERAYLKERGKDKNKSTGENENSIFYFIKRVYNLSSTNDIQSKILASFNENIYNFTLTTISIVCAPLIKILSAEYDDKTSEKEEEIKNVVHKFMNEKKKKDEDNEQLNYVKVDFAFLSEISFELLEKYAIMVKGENGKNCEYIENYKNDKNGKNMDNAKKGLQLFRHQIYFLFPKIYFYVKLFICSNADKYKENHFFPSLFNYIIGVLKYKIIYLLSELYIMLRYKYGKQIGTIFEGNYVKDIFLFLNSSEQYSCVFSDVHQYYDTNKNYNFLSE
ncbi:conserved Plasmodium protein, unknown function [Plasmodium malariae]|uniref:Conserved oligomeric Golgi complex subunit 3 C-terminal domain-containing protein n=1 Tax=Plasmodium malariae TaxID=5858 RepID=A0A1C3L0L6_PLAMA|nr:conserved Plasmodium protein, unknown function [Plasmodium malariae]